MSSSSNVSRPESLKSWLELEYRFDVIADPGGGYVVTFPDLPGCMTQIETLDELPEMVAEAKVIWMRSMVERGLEIPPPTYPESASGKFLVRLPRMLHRALIDRADEEGVSLNQLTVSLLSAGVVARSPHDFRAGRAFLTSKLSERSNESGRRVGNLEPGPEQWMRVLNTTVRAVSPHRRQAARI